MPSLLMAADFNQDGKTDFAVTPGLENGTSLVSFYLSGPKGPLSDIVTYEIGSGPISLLATDLNGDGFPDIASADYTDAAISVILNLPPDFTMSTSLPALSVQRGGRNDRPVFSLLVTACLCVLAVGLITRFGNIPINNQILTWKVGSPPPDWLTIGKEWWRLQTARVILQIAALCLVILAVLMRIK